MDWPKVIPLSRVTVILNNNGEQNSKFLFSSKYYLSSFEKDCFLNTVKLHSMFCHAKERSFKKDRKAEENVTGLFQAGFTIDSRSSFI